jgi:hypothetical protein
VTAPENSKHGWICETGLKFGSAGSQVLRAETSAALERVDAQIVSLFFQRAEKVLAAFNGLL